MTKLRGHTQIKVEGWALNVISHRLPSRAKGGEGNVQNYELSNNARFPSRTKRNRTRISSSLFPLLLYFASRTFLHEREETFKRRYHDRVYDLSIRGGKRENPEILLI